jgi:hypothetical protein
MSWKTDVLQRTLDLIQAASARGRRLARMTAVVARALDAAPLKPAKDDCDDVA